MKIFASMLLVLGISSACKTASGPSLSDIGPDEQELIRSCTVSTASGSYCLESADAGPLAFCGGEVSDEACDRDDFDQTCKKTIRIWNNTESDQTTENGQTLVFFMTKDEYGPGVCDTGSLSKL